jgi:hypothetical protein
MEAGQSCAIGGLGHGRSTRSLIFRRWRAQPPAWLHLIGHSAPLAAAIERERWSVEELDAAFRGPLRAHLQPFARDSNRYEWRGPGIG